MRYFVCLFLFVLTTVPSWAQLKSPEAVETDILEILLQFERMGKKDFTTKWPDGKAKEIYTVGKDGKIAYTKFYPAGNTAVTYQKGLSGAVNYEKHYGDGKDALVLKRDERIIDYTSYWPSGKKKGKYQKNLETKDRYYTAYDAKGKQVYPTWK